MKFGVPASQSPRNCTTNMSGLRSRGFSILAIPGLKAENRAVQTVTFVPLWEPSLQAAVTVEGPATLHF